MPSSPICMCLSCPVHDRDRRTTPCPVYPSSSITDAQWAVLEPLLPPPGNTKGRGGRPEKHPRRLVLDAIFYLVRGGIAWAQLPREFPPHQTVYGMFTRWARHGAWQQIHDALRDLVRVHQGVTRCPPRRSSTPSRYAAPRPCRSKPRLRCREKDQRPETAHRGGHRWAAARGGGHHGRDSGPRRRPPAVDRPGQPVLHDQPHLRRRRLRRTVGHLGKKILSITVEVVKRTDDLTGFTVLPRRWVVERTFAWISKFRRCVRDYETIPTHHEAMIHISMIMTMSRRLARTGIGNPSFKTLSSAQPAPGQLREGLGVGLPTNQCRHHLPTGDPENVRSHHTELDLSVLQQLLHPLLLRGPGPDQIDPVPGQVPQPADLRRRHETRPQHLPFGDLAQPHRVQPVFSELEKRS